MFTTNQLSTQQRYYGGILALLGVVIIWVSSSFLMNNLFGEMEFSKPFLVTYVNTATFSFYLLPLLFKSLLSNYKTHQKLVESFLKSKDESTNLLNSKITQYDSIQIESDLKLNSLNEKLSTLETMKLSLQFCLLWFIANYTTNASLAYTSVGSSTILSSMSGLFTLGIGALFKVEKLNLIKLVAVLLSVLGVSFVSYADNTEGQFQSNAIIGDILALLGAFFYGCYTTLLKLKIGNEDRIDMSLFFGFVGAFNILLLWPMMPILNVLGIESFEIPSNTTLWFMILLNAFIGTFLSDYLWLLSMLMTSPLVVTLGISLTIPLALTGDILFKGFIPNTHYIMGALLVVIGFLVVNSEAFKSTKESLGTKQIS